MVKLINKKLIKEKRKNVLIINVEYMTLDIDFKEERSVTIPETELNNIEFLEFIAVLYACQEASDDTKGNINVSNGYHHVPGFVKYFDSLLESDVKYGCNCVYIEDLDQECSWCKNPNSKMPKLYKYAIEYPCSPTGYEECGWSIENITYRYFDNECNEYDVELKFTNSEIQYISKIIDESLSNLESEIFD
mgnify:FL=1